MTISLHQEPYFSSNRREYFLRKFQGELEKRQEVILREAGLLDRVSRIFTPLSQVYLAWSAYDPSTDLREHGWTANSHVNVESHGWNESEMIELALLTEDILNVAEDIKFKDVGSGVTGSKFVIKTEKNGDKVYKAILKAMNPPVDNISRKFEKNVKQILQQHRPTDNLIKADVKQKMISEVACALLAHHLGFNAELRCTTNTRRKKSYDLVPQTTLIASGGKLQSLQIFIPGAIEAHKIFDPSSVDPGFITFQTNLKGIEKGIERAQNLDQIMENIFEYLTIDFLKIFQLFIVFDFLTGNQDRHDKNWLIKLDDKGHMVGIIAIDNGNSLPAKHLTKGKSIFIEKNQYSWANLVLSKIPFIEKVRHFINKLDYKNINDVLEKIAEETVLIVARSLSHRDSINTHEEKEAYQVISDFSSSKEMRECLKDRLDILKSNIIKTPADLANYKYEDQYIMFKHSQYS